MEQAEEEEEEEGAGDGADAEHDLQPRTLVQCFEVRETSRARLPASPLLSCRHLTLTRACASQLSLPSDGMVLSISLDEFIRFYSSDQNGAIVDLANFLVFASGIRKVRAAILHAHSSSLFLLTHV